MHQTKASSASHLELLSKTHRNYDRYQKIKDQREIENCSFKPQTNISKRAMSKKVVKENVASVFRKDEDMKN